MAVIDFHTHAFPDALAPRAMAKLQAGSSWRAVAGGTVGELLASMDECGAEVSVVCAIATKPGQAQGILDWCRSIRSKRIVPLPSVHPRDPDVRDWVRRFAADGFRGIKLHPMYQDTPADDDCMNAIYEAAAESGLLVVSHCGKDIAYPPEIDRSAPARFRRVADRFPNLTLICTHLGGWRDWDAVEEHILGIPVYLETSFSLDELGPKRAADFILRHGVNRVLLGSDWPWQSQAHAIGLVRGLPVTDDQKDRILRENAANLLG